MTPSEIQDRAAAKGYSSEALFPKKAAKPPVETGKPKEVTVNIPFAQYRHELEMKFGGRRGSDRFEQGTPAGTNTLGAESRRMARPASRRIDDRDRNEAA